MKDQMRYIRSTLFEQLALEIVVTGLLPESVLSPYRTPHVELDTIFASHVVYLKQVDGIALCYII